MYQFRSVKDEFKLKAKKFKHILKFMENPMKSKIAEALRLRHETVAILWTDERPEAAMSFKGRAGFN